MTQTPHRLPLEASLHHLAICSPDPHALAAFYARTLAMRIEERDGAWFATGPDRHLSFLPGAARTLAFAAYSVAGPHVLEDLADRCALTGVAVEAWQSDLLDSGAISVVDPDGNRIVFGVARTSPMADASLVARLQHVVMASTDAPRLSAFYQDVLGFVLSDNVVDDAGGLRTAFLRCGAEHHSFAVFQAAKCWFDHHCYEAGDWGLIRDWGDHFAACDVPVQWGPGRHGPGNNLFVFVHDPDGNWVEISAELEIVSQDRQSGTWKHEQRTLNSWGSAPLRS